MGHGTVDCEVLISAMRTGTDAGGAVTRFFSVAPCVLHPEQFSYHNTKGKEV